MSKLNLIAFIICLLMVTSCSPEKVRVEEVIMECIYKSYNDNGRALKKAIQDYETLLVEQNIIKDKTGKSYKETLMALAKDNNFKNRPSISFNSFIGDIGSLDSERYVVCQKTLIDTSNYDSARLNKINQVVKKHMTSSDLNINLILSDINNFLSEEDFDFDYYKFQTFRILDLFELDKGLLRTLPEANDESSKEKNLSNALSIYIDEKNTIFINDKKSSLKEVRKTVRNYYLENTSESIVTLIHKSGTSYAEYIAVQNEITSAINSLREKLALKLYKKDLDSLTKEELTTIREKYPLNLIEKSLD